MDREDATPVDRPLGPFPAAVLFLHGQPGSARDWKAVVHLLGVAAPATRAVVPDRPGWGSSSEAPGGLFDNADHLVDVLEDAGAGPVVVVGHSWGGGVALAFAARHPRRVAGLVLAGSLNPTQEPGILDAVFGLVVAGPILARLYERFLANFPRMRRTRRLLARRYPRRPDEDLRREFVQAYRSWLRPGMWRSLVVEERRYRGEQHVLRGDLHRILVPAIVLVGDRDEFETVGAAQALADALPRGVLSTIADAGHGIPWSRPGVFVRAIADAVSAAPDPHPRVSDRGARASGSGS